MAEQEACAELVKEASHQTEQSSGAGEAIEGESLLLPLLQGLLEAPENDQTPDSGTESGEDQRNGLIIEVQNALDKLAISLRSDATDVTPERRTSLLYLVTKLQAGLATSSAPSGGIACHQRRGSQESASSASNHRFNNRKLRKQTRHTVGVSSEELADARRLIEEISLTPSQSETKISLMSPNKTNSVVKNAVAKPFSSSSSSSLVQTPSSEGFDFLFNEEQFQAKKMMKKKKSMSLDYEDANLHSHRSTSGTMSLDLSSPSRVVPDEEEASEEDTRTVKAPMDEQIVQNNPIYYKPTTDGLEERVNRFNSKKLKMKRANTIDIPKPLNFYLDEDDDSDDCALNDQRRRSTYYALRGPIRMGQTNGNLNQNNKVPVFEPKTDSDKKFLAFINKHNENNSVSNKSSLWEKSNQNHSSSKPTWGNKFGNIKSTFENHNPSNNAMKFWHTANNNTSTKLAPSYSRKSAKMFEEHRHLEQAQPQKPPWSNCSTTAADKSNNIVTGTLKVNTNKAFENNKSGQALPAMNRFSHAPQSAFKPLATKKVPAVVFPKKESNPPPLYLYSPKPMYTPNQSSTPSPVSIKPWTQSVGEHRNVLSLAAAKFENNSTTTSSPEPYKPRRLSKETNKVFIPPVLNNIKETNNGRLSGQFKPLEFTSKTSLVRYVEPTAPPPQQYYQHVPGQDYVQQTQPPPPPPVVTVKIEPALPKLQSQTSLVEEYNAVSSKVMSGPVSQQAVTVRQKSPMSRDAHDMEAAFNLRSLLQSKVNNLEVPPGVTNNFAPPNEREVVSAHQIRIPLVQVVPSVIKERKASALSKSDSWHQICSQQQVVPSPATRSSNSTSLAKSKSSHSLALPKQYEAGMSKDEMLFKKRTMEAFMSGTKSPSGVGETKVKKSSINRIKTSEKVGIYQAANGGLSRSRTLPDIVCPELLDESNVDKAFEALFKSNS